MRIAEALRLDIFEVVLDATDLLELLAAFLPESVELADARLLHPGRSKLAEGDEERHGEGVERGQDGSEEKRVGQGEDRLQREVMSRERARRWREVVSDLRWRE